MNRSLAGVIISACALVLSACAFDVVRVDQQPAALEVAPNPPPPLRLQESVSVKLGTGYSRQLNAGTRWDYVGSVDEGDVYKTDDQVLTVEASNIYEAYIVLREQELVGFYLPVEQTYSPLGEGTPLHLTEQ